MVFEFGQISARTGSDTIVSAGKLQGTTGETSQVGRTQPSPAPGSNWCENFCHLPPPSSSAGAVPMSHAGATGET